MGSRDRVTCLLSPTDSEVVYSRWGYSAPTLQGRVHCQFVLSFTIVCISNVVVRGAIYLVMCWALHFLLLNDRPDSDVQTCRLPRLFCRCLQSFPVLMVENSLVSSANIATWLNFAASGRSLTYSAKRTAPSIVPWGTPDVTERLVEVAPSTVTRCWRFGR